MYAINKLLVIVDMNNGFTREGVFKNSYLEALIPGINELAHSYDSTGNTIALINEKHTVNSAEFRIFPPHCIAGTSEAEIVDELKWIMNDYKIFYKNSTNGMLNDNFREYLHNFSLREVVIVGGVTDICVFELALSMKKFFDNANMDIPVIVAENLVDTYDAPWHDRVKYSEAAFMLLRQAGIIVKNISLEVEKKYVKENRYGK